MKRLIRKLRPTSFLSILLALMGFSVSGCFGRVEYGTPNADWSVKGRVVDETNCPVGGLQVALGNRFENTQYVIYDVNYKPLDTLQTAGDGTYMIERSGFPIEQLDIHVQDIDGELRGGEFEDAHLIIKMIEYTGGKGWYTGHADIEVPDIIVKKKD